MFKLFITERKFSLEYTARVLRIERCNFKILKHNVKLQIYKIKQTNNCIELFNDNYRL